MKKIYSKLAVLLITCFGLASCNTTPILSNSEQNSLDSGTSNSLPSTSEPSINNPSVDDSTISSPSVDDPSIDSPSSEGPSITIPSADDSEIPSKEIDLPIGNKSVSGPKNTVPHDINNWINYDLKSSLPEYFSYIQGNNKVNNCFDFYQSEDGGFKFSKLYYGLQTPLLTSWKKVEVRLRISDVRNNSQKLDENAPIFHVYSYDKNGNYLQNDPIAQGKITMKTKGSELSFYIRNIDMAYFEIRLNAYPYKGSQCYNFGVNQVSVKGWNYD